MITMEEIMNGLHTVPLQYKLVSDYNYAGYEEI